MFSLSTNRIRRAWLPTLKSKWRRCLMGNIFLFHVFNTPSINRVYSFGIFLLPNVRKLPLTYPLSTKRIKIWSHDSLNRSFRFIRMKNSLSILRLSSSSSSLQACPLNSQSSNRPENNNNNNHESSGQEKSNLDSIDIQVSSDTNRTQIHQPGFESSDEFIIQKTLSWIQNVVIQLNLCPFAEKPFRSSKLFTSVVRGMDEDEIISVILYESILRRDEEGTTVVICPEYFPNQFEEYLHLVHVMEEVLQDHELDGYIQIAPFHPLFEFEGSGKDGLDNWTNRSPYPIFHILREEEVSVAVDKIGGDSSKVWKRNISFLHVMEKTLGREDTERALKGEEVKGVADILKRIRSKEL